MKAIGLDVGNGSTCIVIRTEEGRVLSKYYASTYGLYDGERTKKAIDTKKPQADAKIFTLGGRDYVVGYEDLKNVGSNPVSTYGREERIHLGSYQMLTKLALLDAATLDGATGVIEVSLAFGVPNDDYKESTVSTITKWFAEPVAGNVNGNQVIVMVKHFEVLSQPIAVFVDAYYDDNGFVQDEALEEEDVLVIDGGSGTLDMTELRGNKIQKQTSENIGMNDVYQRIVDEIEKREPKVRVDAYDLEYQIRNCDNLGNLVYKQGPVSISIADLYQTALNDVWDQMVGRVERRCPDRMRFHRVLLGGGTGDAYSSRFTQWMPQIQKIVDPQLAIARGLCKEAVVISDDSEVA